MHARFMPRAHRFTYRIFLFAIDLDELDTLDRKLSFFSRGRRNLYSFRDGDYLPTNELLHSPGNATPQPREVGEKTLKERVTAYLASQGIDLAGGRVMLVTLPRVLGYLFNPVSFYFCYGPDGAPLAAIAEVTNTFREMKPYFLGPTTQAEPGTFARRTPKHFYVSPYSDVDVEFDFKLRSPGDKLSIQIDDYVGTDRTLTSSLTGPSKALTSSRLAWFTLKYPLITLKVISLIHWHALLLWIKRLPWFAKGNRAADQRDLYRPHASLAPAKAGKIRTGPPAASPAETF